MLWIMTDQSGRESDSGSSSSVGDSICAGFTRRWMQGERPRIEDESPSLAVADRPTVLKRFLALELEFRRATGEEPQSGDYVERLSAFPEVVAEVFGTELAADDETVTDPAVEETLLDSSPQAEDGQQSREVTLLEEDTVDVGTQPPVSQSDFG